MECNKEEAVRARDIAEKKLEGKDFVTARKFALKAQHLFPGLENVSQILTVCEVYYSAGIKLNGETDWYGVLKVDSTSDDTTIKKQYKKLALLLHPDKNKLPGAEAAFKIVVEAQRILIDQAKRLLYDTKIGVNFRNVPSRQSAQQSKRTSGTSMPGVSSNMVNNSSINFGGSNQQQKPPFSSDQTFWTICPFCGVRYPYYHNVLKKVIFCQSCMKIFIAHDLNAQAVPSWPNPGFSANHTVPRQEFQSQKCQGPGGFQGKAGVESTSSRPYSVSGSRTEGRKKENEVQAVNGVKFEKVKLQEVNKREWALKSPVENARGKRTRTYPSTRLENCKARVGNSENADDDLCFRSSVKEKLAAGTIKVNSFHLNVENVQLDESVPESQPSKDPVSTGSNAACNEEHKQAYTVQHSALNAAEHVENDMVLRPAVNAKEGGNETGKTNIDDADEHNDSPISFPSPMYDYPDSEFHNFDGARSSNKFARGQIWALYSEVDTYPKYYGLIRKVELQTFKLVVSWLVACPVREGEKRWQQELPISCGTFKRTSEKSIFDTAETFSHLVQAVPADRRGYYDIYPNSGEVWALYKYWSIGWSLSALEEAEYDLVEILSRSDSGIKVLMLTKVDGYTAVFMPGRKGLASSAMEILTDEYLRFSHQIPAFRLTEERGGKLRGYWELDPASVPQVYMFVNSD